MRTAVNENRLAIYIFDSGQRGNWSDEEDIGSRIAARRTVVDIDRIWVSVGDGERNRRWCA